MYYRYKPIIRLLVRITALFPRSVLRFFYALIEPFPGVLFVLFRYLIISKVCKSVGDNVYVANFVELRNAENLQIGSNVSIQKGCYIDALGGIVIGNDVSIAHQSSLISFDHGWKDKTLPIRKNPYVLESIELADDIWIGAGVRILAGARIGRRCIVAAGAVVTRRTEVAAGALLAGVPARKKLTLDPEPGGP
jgi:acetyltransferase-like isoleucine patch superfamily enzyme